MSNTLKNDALNIRKLLREAEALADESMIACARLKQAMLTARQNPAAEVCDGQRALVRLNQAEDQAMSMSNNLLRVHEELNKVARERMAGDEPIETVFPDNATAEIASKTSVETHV